MTEQLQSDFEKILKTSDIPQNEVNSKRGYLEKFEFSSNFSKSIFNCSSI